MDRSFQAVCTLVYYLLEEDPSIAGTRTPTEVIVNHRRSRDVYEVLVVYTEYFLASCGPEELPEWDERDIGSFEASINVRYGNIRIGDTHHPARFK